MTEISYEWLEKVQGALSTAGQLPEWEEAFSFPWGDLSQIARALELPDLKISCRSSTWKKESEYLLGMGKEPIISCVELSPIPAPLFWIFPSEDVAFFSHLLISSEGFSDSQLQEGFYHFLFVRALAEIDKMKILKDIKPHLMPETPLPKEGALCIEVALQFSNKTLSGRLLCSNPFLQGFKDREPLPKLSLLKTEAAKKLEVILRFEIGSTSLSTDEWKQIKPGDFIILDRCSYDPKTDKGSITLFLGNTPLLRARLKDEGVKVLDYAFYHEEALADTEGEELFTEEIDNLGEENLSMETAISNEYTPVNLIIEAGRLRMNLEKLLELKAGSTLDISVKPQQDVDVTLNEKKVAKAELVKLGETLGIKILHVER